MLLPRVRLCTLFSLLILLSAPVAFAQQTGSIQGKVTDTGGGVLPGVTVEARSDVLPGPRVAVSGADGAYQLAALPPGNYTVTFTLAGMQTVTKQVRVVLAEITRVEAAMAVGGVKEEVTVTGEASLVDKSTATIASGVPNDQISKLPVGQEYRDLIKLIPGVQYTQDAVRGPSAGSNGQDNTYKFDGVNVTLPLFGTLSAEPASHDIAEVNVVKGGATAIDFKRAGGFAIDSVSKSGTSRYSGQASFQFQTHDMAAKRKIGSSSTFQENQYWTEANLGGPLLKDRLFFFGSYYRPQVNRENQANVYGNLPRFESTRNEGFGKITGTPSRNTLVNASYRDSKRDDTSSLFGSFTAPTAGTGNASRQKIGTADGSWIINAMSYVNFKYTHFALLTAGVPDQTANATVSTDVGSHLDINNLDKMGQLLVPGFAAGADAFNAFIAPLVDKYGYVCTPDLVAAGTCPTAGVRAGGSTVGFGSLFDHDDFFRDAGEFAYNGNFSGMGMQHRVHAGYQNSLDAETLARSSNGWGVIRVPGGRTTFPASNGTPIFYSAEFQQQGLGEKGVPPIHSEFRAQNIEVNDAISWKNWTYNIGLLASHDTLYGQGLNNAPGTLSGYVLATGTTSESRKYTMYTVPFKKMLQPRLGATYAYDGKNTAFVSFARYDPMASSLPRAASWDRNIATTIQAYFDANGNLFAVDPLASSSGKLFVPNMTPPRHDEWLIGTARQFGQNLTARAYFRYNRGSHYWEDTNNNARTSFSPPDVLPGTDVHIPTTLYIPNLTDQRTQIGQSAGRGPSGSTYVIAELDGAFTRYKELTVETEYRGSKGFVRGSYTRSRYFGNFDQDNSTVTTSNDGNIFIGSSNIGDGPGRQLWDNKLGVLTGDRPNAVKIYGAYFLPWQGTAGAYVIAQSGQPWEKMDFSLYSNLTSSTNETDKYAEPAGSRRAPSHAQMDLNYTQNVKLAGRYTAQVAVDAYNVFNSQTGYNFEPRVHNAGFGQPQSFFDPSRVQVAFRFQF
jgi:hypothetical protein